MLVEDMPDGKEARPDNVGSDLKSGSVIVVSANMELTLGTMVMVMGESHSDVSVGPVDMSSRISMRRIISSLFGCPKSDPWWWLASRCLFSWRCCLPQTHRRFDFRNLILLFALWRRWIGRNWSQRSRKFVRRRFHRPGVADVICGRWWVRSYS